jgi:hypothetical protein
MSRKRRLSQQDLRAAGVTPSLMARRIGADGRARLEQLTPEPDERRRSFAQRLSDDTSARDEEAWRVGQPSGPRTGSS